MKVKALLFILLMLLVIGCSADDNMAMNHGDGGHSGEMSEMDMEGMGVSVPDGLDLATEKMSDNGVFQLEVEPLVNPIVINEIHTWQLTVTDADMQPVEDATVTFGGGMPEHDHGFPTEPEVVAGDEAGTYLIEGVKMQMSGWWEMKLDISTEAMADTVTFNIVLP